MIERGPLQHGLMWMEWDRVHQPPAHSWPHHMRVLDQLSWKQSSQERRGRERRNENQGCDPSLTFRDLWSNPCFRARFTSGLQDYQGLKWLRRKASILKKAIQ